VKFFERRTGRWWAFSIAAHAIIIALLLQVMFEYPLGQLMGIRRQELKPERLQYIALPAPPTEHSGGGAPPAAKAGAPAALRAPVVAPTQVPDATPVDTSRSQAAGGAGTGVDVGGSGFATGLVPRQPDARIALQPGVMIRTPRTVAEDVDRIVDLAVGVYVDSMAETAKQRKPGDWTFKGKDGQVWGVDQNNIYLGKYRLPSAVLALLPLNKGNGGSPIEARSAAFIRRDVLENAQRAVSEDEFRAAVKRIRERKEREKREKQLAADSKTAPQTQ
jgi:hypothetical protein